MQPRKQHLIDTALVLFNQHGYHATGIDLILAKSGVSKATLYKHYRSKEDLILAVLQQRHEQVIGMLSNAMLNANSEGKSTVLALFDGLDAWFNSQHFYGCNFINASAEYADASSPIHILAAEHKLSVVNLVRTQLTENSKDLADKISLLIDGAIVMAHTRNVKNSALIAKEMAKIIIGK